MIMRRVIVGDSRGIHALVAHRLLAEGDRFQSSIFLSYGGRTASLRNPVAVLALGVPGGRELELRADGADEIEAASAVALLLEGGG
ncbi:HPr family phosphocarrier protein [Pengzhenrongella sp.]|jgi:phosphotransferase system HPr (HPr) family protein|uniref:HPr family phosphocarrier protein n=1 Tax=Pengzhenrongella sp. TaxID=2888820 RepID=UPI002F93AD99